MKKKVLISLVVVFLLLSLVLCVACNKKAPLDQVIDCAKELQGMMANPDTFEITGTCGYQKHYRDEDTTYLNTYIAIPFKVQGVSGKEYEDVAIFVDGKFIGYGSDYSSNEYKKWSSESKQLKFLQGYLIYLEAELGERTYTNAFSKDQINSALNIGVSGEAGSGVASGEDAE